MLHPTLMWSAIALTIGWIQVVAHRLTRPNAPWGGPWPAVPWSSDGRVAFDSGLYLHVAESGYRLDEGLEAGFPAFALAIRHLAAVTDTSYATAGVLISLASGLAVAILAHRWMTLVGLRPRAVGLGVALTLLFPSSYLLYGVVYADGLLLASTLAALVLAEQRRWTAAGVAGALATATKPNGMVLGVVLLLLAATRSGALEVVVGRARRRWRPPAVRWHRGRFGPRHLGVLLAFAGIGAYAAWLWHHAGDPLHFARLQTDAYGHTPIWHPYAWLKIPVWRPVPSALDWGHELASLALIMGAAATIGPIVVRFGLAYGAFVALSILTSWSGTYNLAPAGRYLLPCIPILMAAWAPGLLERPRLAAAVVGSSAIAMAALAAGFAGAFPLNW